MVYTSKQLVRIGGIIALAAASLSAMTIAGINNGVTGVLAVAAVVGIISGIALLITAAEMREPRS